MNILLRLAIVSVLFVPVCLELRTATERGIQQALTNAGRVPELSAMHFRSEAHRRLFIRLQEPRAAARS